VQRKDESGFTLIELMVVVLVLAILLGIAIPTFLGTTKKANDRAAQSDLRNSQTAAKTLFVDTQDYSTITTTQMGNAEPSLTFTSGASTGQGTVSIAVGGSGSTSYIGLAELAKNGNCWRVYQPATAAPTYDFVTGAITGSSCTALTTALANRSFPAGS